MKHIYVVILLLFSFNVSFAQDELLTGQWSLDSVFDYDILLEDPTQSIIIEFTDAGNEIIINDFCGESYTSQYTSTTNDDTIVITGSDTPPMQCSEDNQGFQIATYNLLGYDTGEPKILDYFFTQNGDITTLTLDYSIVIEGIPTGVTGTFSRVSQTNLAINGEWFVQYINTDGVQHNDYSSIFIDFDFYEEFDELNFNGGTGCDGYAGNFEIIDNNTISNYGITRLAICDPGSNAYGMYAEKYYDILRGQYLENPTYLNYEITGLGVDETLTISNQFGDFVVYGRVIPNATIFKTWYSYSTETEDGIIYPSPLDNTTLTISSNGNPSPVNSSFFINGSGGCNEFDAYHNIYASNENEFGIFDLTQTFVECDENLYEPTYLSVLGNEIDAIFSYELQDDGNTLVLTNAIGEVLTFGEQAPPANMIGQWYLYHMVIDGNLINNPSGSTPDIFFTIDPGDLLGSRLHGSGACNSFQSDYYFNPQQTFNAEFISATLSLCYNTEEELFENYYFYQALSTVDGNTELDYEITGTGDDATLVVTNLTNGNQSFFGRQALSIDDNEFNLSKITLHRNPVSNSLDLSTNQNIIGSHYEIFSITGQRITNGVLDSNSIIVNQLHSGLYVLKVSKDENVFETVTFIKN